MPSNNQELEVKFYLTNLPALERRLQEIGAVVAHARVHETNLRFDTPEGELAKTLRVLRLRQDTAARVTYKGPGELSGGVRLRQEIEFTVSDFNNARTLFEALGYTVYLMYEKHRTTYRLGEVLVTLDEMPFGSFAEIEGPDPESIAAVNQQLGLDWETRILDSYTGLFDRLCQRLGLNFRDLSFANFNGLTISPEDLEVKPADKI
jgi:adenylate cyclase class 2